MGAHSWRDEFMVFGPFPWEELLVEEHSMKAEQVPDAVEGKREIPSALERMDRALGDLFESIDSLGTRLSPVLHADHAEENETSVPRELLSTDIGRIVDSAAFSVAGAAARLRALRDRVEL